MADNLDDDTLDHPLIPQSENLSDEIICTNAPVTVTPQETEKMEVHKHPHHITHKKKWFEYFLEFVMLFLAVFLGFIAENIREHEVEKEREKQYIYSMIEDLGEDTLTLTTSINDLKPNVQRMDTLIQLLSSKNLKNKGADLYYFGRRASRGNILAINDRTIQQMKNSGGFRLITNENASKKIIEYYNELRTIDLLQSTELNETNEYRKMAVSVFHPVISDSTVRADNSVGKPLGNPSLLTYDRTTLLRLAGMVSYTKNTRIGIIKAEEQMKLDAKNLISLLKQKYHFD